MQSVLSPATCHFMWVLIAHCYEKAFTQIFPLNSLNKTGLSCFCWLSQYWFLSQSGIAPACSPCFMHWAYKSTVNQCLHCSRCIAQSNLLHNPPQSHIRNVCALRNRFLLSTANFASCSNFYVKLYQFLNSKKNHRAHDSPTTYDRTDIFNTTMNSCQRIG